MEARDYVRALLRKGMTQSQIEARTGITQASVSKIARGAVRDVLSQRYRALQDLHAEVVEHRPPLRRARPPAVGGKRPAKTVAKRAKRRGAGQ